MIWTYVWRFQDVFPVLGMLKITLLIAVLSIALFAINRDPTRRLGHLKTPILFCGLGMLGLAFLGVPTSLWPRRSAIVALTSFVPNLAMMVLLAASVRGMRDLEWIALVNFLGALAFSIFVGLTSEVAPDERLGSPIYYDANDLALVLICTIPFGVFFLIRGRWHFRVVAIVGLLLLITTVVRTGSRGGFLGFIAVLAYVLVRYRAIPTRTRLLAVASGFGLVLLVAGDSYWERIGTLRNPQEDYNWSGRAAEGRMEVWKRGVGYMAAHPFLGVGMGNFHLAEGVLSEESKARTERGAGFKWSAAHNSFLEIGAELGVIGLTLFVGMLVSALRSLHRIKSARPSKDRATTRKVALACTLSASLVGFIVSGFFISAWYFSYVYLVLALVMGLAKVERLGLDAALVASHPRLSRLERAILPSEGRRVR